MQAEDKGTVPNATGLHLIRWRGESTVGLPGSGATASCLLLLFLWISLAGVARGQEKPYFVTYDHHLEEPGNLEIAFNPVAGFPGGPPGYLAVNTEFEYGAKAWWTTEFYLDAQHTSGDSSLFNGFRWENRFRPLMREHWINPVLYVEFENLNGAEKSLKEVVGFDGKADLLDPNGVARREKNRELDLKLILSSQIRGWNISENFISEKNLAGEPWEFGYAVGASRPLALMASARECRFCRENFRAGMEFYGGLGTAQAFTLRGTSHYLAPVLAWDVSNGTTLRISPGWGLTAASQRFLLRFGVSYEVAGFGRAVRRLFR